MSRTRPISVPVGSERNALARLRAPAARAARDLLYLLAVLGMSIVGFAVWVDGLSLTASLLILIVGFVVWLGTAHVCRATVAVDRRLAAWIRGAPIPVRYRRPREPGLWARVRTVTQDPQTWRDFGWLVINSVLGFGGAAVALTLTGVVIGYISTPLWWWAVSNPHDQYGTLNLGLYTVTSTGWAFVTTGIGLLLAPVALTVNRRFSTAHAALAARILGMSERQQLDARVEELVSTRADVVVAANEQLERIERDLHDGAQARLVALAMELGMAEQDAAASDTARETVRRTREEVLTALGELRDLSRGLRPALLQDRGLAIAIDDLAQRAPLAVSVSVGGDVDRVPEPVQAAAYFVVAEALTNVARHSAATEAKVMVERAGGALAATVIDDGRGGADPTGHGLAGLRKRVRALDGRLDVTSPPGGPTIVRTEIPCA